VRMGPGVRLSRFASLEACATMGLGLPTVAYASRRAHRVWGALESVRKPGGLRHEGAVVAARRQR